MENLKGTEFTSLLTGPSSVSTSQVGMGPMESHPRSQLLDKKANHRDFHARQRNQQR